MLFALALSTLEYTGSFGESKMKAKLSWYLEVCDRDDGSLQRVFQQHHAHATFYLSTSYTKLEPLKEEEEIKFMSLDLTKMSSNHALMHSHWVSCAAEYLQHFYNIHRIAVSFWQHYATKN